MKIRLELEDDAARMLLWLLRRADPLGVFTAGMAAGIERQLVAAVRAARGGNDDDSKADGAGRAGSAGGGV